MSRQWSWRGERYLTLFADGKVYDQYMEVDDEQAEENADQDGFEADEMNQLFFDYTVATYNAFMEGADEFSAIDQQLTSYLGRREDRFDGYVFI